MWRILIFTVVILMGCGGGNGDDTAGTSEIPKTSSAIVPAVETSPTSNNGAKTSAIWVHPTDTALSAVIGADQKDGIQVYDLYGNLIHTEPVGEMNGIDLRYHFSLNDQSVTLIAASNRTDNTLKFYTINPDTLQLTDITAPLIKQDISVESLCMYHSPINGKYYAILISADGNVQQWEIFQTSAGTVNGRLKRRFEVGTQISACVADDQYTHLYIAAGSTLLKYSAEPQDGTARIQLESFAPQISAMTLYYAKGQTGYLIASSIDTNDFLVYQRGNDNVFLGRFAIETGNDIDGVDKTNGIAVTNAALNQTFPHGLLVAQDTDNTEPSANTNYKLVSWEPIANSLNLMIDTVTDPRKILGVEEESRAIKKVQATVETEPVPVGGDAADDIAIWVHPQDTALSTVIGTQKKEKKGGLLVYDLAGQQIQYKPDGRMNNVDLRYDFPLDQETVSLVAASNRTNNSIALYKVNPLSRQLENVAARIIKTGFQNEIYGLCLYHNPSTHQYYVFASDKNGDVEQWQVFDNGNGSVDGTLVRSFSVGSITEGCVVDDQEGVLYLSEEKVGIWKYDANPNGGDTRIQVDSTKGHLTADIEGLTIYKGEGSGYLIASSQGANTFSIYNRSGNNDYLGTFKIVANDALKIDRVTDMDGIDVVSTPLGSAFPQGLFVVQDGWNTRPVSNQNFKLVPWENIAEALGLAY
jgi:3-phytase